MHGKKNESRQTAAHAAVCFFCITFAVTAGESRPKNR